MLFLLDQCAAAGLHLSTQTGGLCSHGWHGVCYTGKKWSIILFIFSLWTWEICVYTILVFLKCDYNERNSISECWEINASHIWDRTQQGMGSVDWQDDESLQDDWQENVSVSTLYQEPVLCFACQCDGSFLYPWFSQVAVNVSTATVQEATGGSNQEDWEEELPLWASLWPKS